MADFFQPLTPLPMRQQRNVVRHVNWNLLAFQNAKNDEKGFPLASAKTLDPEQRRLLIAKYLLRVCRDADFVTLQEVDELEFVEKSLSFKNFATWYEKRHDSSLGLLIAWNNDKYELVEKRSWRYRGSGQIGMLVHLRDKIRPQGHTVMVATTHLKSGTNKPSAMLRSKQAGEFFSRAENAHDEAAISPRLLIMAGDFNNHGDEHIQWTQDSDAYCHYRWTTRKQRKEGEIIQEHEDFIFHDGLTLSVLDPSNYLDDAEEAILPNEQFPSDHILMVADIAFE